MRVKTIASRLLAVQQELDSIWCDVYDKSPTFASRSVRDARILDACTVASVLLRPLVRESDER